MDRLTPRTLVVILATAVAAQTLCAQYVFNPEHRRAIDRTREDLEKAQIENPTSSSQHELYVRALRDLKDVADRLRSGVFERNKLDQAISEVQRVVDEVKLNGGDQESLRRDNNELRRLRQHPDDHYRFPR